MSRTMFDSIDVTQIPSSAAMVAGYVDGHWPTAGALAKRFPHARLVTITVLGGSLDADVVDIEQGDCTPRSGVAWAKRKIAAGKGHPTLYCSLSAWPAVKAEVHRQGLDGKVSYWIADYDGKAVVPGGAVAKQYTDRALSRNLDASIVADYWPGVDPAPKPHVDPTPAPTPTPAPVPILKGDDMFLIEASGDSAVYIVEAKGKRHVGPDEYHVYVAAGVKKITVTAKQRDAIPNL